MNVSNVASLQTTQHLFEFMDPRISKSFGLQKLMEMHGFTMENLCTFGDADNDYDMTLHAGVGVVMANGSEKNKSVADHITKDNDHDGIGSVSARTFDLQIIRIWGLKI